MSRRRKLSHDERMLIYDRMNRRCAYCGRRLKYEEMHIDHVRPLAKGGPDTLDNMVCACETCNAFKACRDLETFRHRILKSVIELEKTQEYMNAIKYGLVRRTHAPVVFYFERMARKELLRCRKKCSRSKRF